MADMKIRVQAKISGRGRQIITEICNIDAIADQLNTDVETVMNYIADSLQTQRHGIKLVGAFDNDTCANVLTDLREYLANAASE